MKILTRTTEDAYPRFKREVEIVSGLDPARWAVLPVLDSSLPESPSESDPGWFVMPIATRLKHALHTASLSTKVEAIQSIADTLAGLLVEHGINHRDLKPANLFLLDGRPALGDFGLAVRPEDDALTATGHVVGPFAFLPSDAFHVEDPDWERIDVACLTASLWCLIAGREPPPRGQIQAGGPYSLARIVADDGDYRDLDRLIERATADAPEARPTLRQLSSDLAGYLEGLDLKDQFRRAAEQMQAAEDTLVRWLVREARRDIHAWGRTFDVSESEALSEVNRLTNTELSYALQGLVDRYLIRATPAPTTRAVPDYWNNVELTNAGVDEVEERAAIIAEAAPILRHLFGGGALPPLGFRDEPAVEISDVSFAPARLYFLLRYLDQGGLISFRAIREGPGWHFTDARLTPSGRYALTNA